MVVFHLIEHVLAFDVWKSIGSADEIVEMAPGAAGLAKLGPHAIVFDGLDEVVDLRVVVNWALAFFIVEDHVLFGVL